MNIESWEIVRVKAKIPYYLSDNSENLDQYDYVLLHKEEHTTLGEKVEHHELRIIMQPIIQVRGIKLFLFEGYNKKIWTIKANSFSKELNFAESTFIEVPRDFKGRGLGSYVFSKFIKWAKQYHPGFKVKSLNLSEYQSVTEEEKNRRNSFYRNFGFKLEFSDKEEKKGYAVIENVDLLHEYYNSEKVEAVSFEDFVKDVVSKNQEYREENQLIIKEARKIIEKKEYKIKNLLIIIIVLIVLLIITWFK